LVILRNHLYRGHKVDRSGEGSVIVDVEDRSLGQGMEIECNYLVGADGTRSKVREDLGIQM
jgi:2-polyprenyl-6-methoxyphenol hydroxylase-like FAD-dependent oxidoreductase